jgi:hypothetical protein
MLKLNPDIMATEMEQIKELIEGIEKSLEQVPGDDAPATDENVDIFEYRLKGVLRLAAERLLSIVESLE